MRCDYCGDDIDPRSPHVHFVTLLSGVNLHLRCYEEKYDWQKRIKELKNGSTNESV